MIVVFSDTPVRRRPDVLHSRVDDGVYALDTASGACFAFRGPSARLWEMLEAPLSATSAAERLVREFEIDQERCTREVTEHFRKLHEEGLIAVAGG